jgi:hypothetical protein
MVWHMCRTERGWQTHKDSKGVAAINDDHSHEDRLSSYELQICNDLMQLLLRFAELDL